MYSCSWSVLFRLFVHRVRIPRWGGGHQRVWKSFCQTMFGKHLLKDSGHSNKWLFCTGCWLAGSITSFSLTFVLIVSSKPPSSQQGNRNHIDWVFQLTFKNVYFATFGWWALFMKVCKWEEWFVACPFWYNRSLGRYDDRANLSIIRHFHVKDVSHFSD